LRVSRRPRQTRIRRPSAGSAWTWRAERLDWVPAVLASLDRPFVIERPDELRGLVVALAERLAASARAG